MSLDLIAHQIRANAFVIHKNTESVSQEESLIAPASGGNCLNWVVGHIVASRNSILKVLGEKPIFDEAARYARGTKGIEGEALPLTTLLATLDASQETIVSGLRNFDAARLSEPAPSSPTGNPKETLGTLLASLSFHESYHAGQTGVLRRIAGKRGAIA